MATSKIKCKRSKCCNYLEKKGKKEKQRANWLKERKSIDQTKKDDNSNKSCFSQSFLKAKNFSYKFLKDKFGNLVHCFKFGTLHKLAEVTLALHHFMVSSRFNNLSIFQQEDNIRILYRFNSVSNIYRCDPFELFV